MGRYLIICLLGLCLINPSHAQGDLMQKKDSLNKIYVGTYTKKEGHVDGKGLGIYLLDQNSDTGHLTFVCTAAELINPSFVKAGKMGKYVYAVSELGPADANSGFVYSFEIQDDGSLKNIGKLSTGGLAPCHIALDRSGKFAFVSNYLGGIVMVYKVTSNGSLIKSQELKLENSGSAHAHSVKVSGDNRYAYIADLGNNMVWIYNFNNMNGTLEPHRQKFIKLKDGAGPRHISFSRNGSFVYTVNELNSTVSAFRVKNDGSLEHLNDISTLPESYRHSNSAADIHIHPSGKYLYTSNRGHDSIAIFEINQDSGELSHVDYVPVAGKTPRNFAISPYGKYLYAASQDTGNITTYKINENTGKLKPQEPVFQIKTPVCLEFVK
ncbi:lactonase family protein [Christiangramia sabulilitoris]|uniref:Lactonase family protein n=1 Tax=Christiangramia sabulilitoris TaxID=2583991 RepID=A0A550I5Y9_9FLAO|nr:lactonase family protein [Christiangramia sabulilitoris]TRO66394.1 lactonase family protein [Christiangramia sabulilitoris]